MCDAILFGCGSAALGKMDLEQVKIGVDVADQSDLVRQEQHGADASGAEPPERDRPVRTGTVAVIMGTSAWDRAN